MQRESVTLDRPTLRKRVARFVDKELATLPGFAGLRALAPTYGPMAIFGGLIRDLALGYSRDFSSDIDVVLKGMPADVLARQLDRYNAKRNAFGGFRVEFGRWAFDLWTFESTWAFTQGLVEGKELADLLRTTFFNWDAALFSLDDKELIVRPSYLEELEQRWLAINLRATPNELGAAVRAFRLMAVEDVTLTPDLAQFLHSQIIEHGIHRIVSEDSKRTGRRRLTTGIVGTVAIALREHQATRADTPFAFASFQQRLPLGSDGQASVGLRGRA